MALNSMISIQRKRRIMNALYTAFIFLFSHTLLIAQSQFDALRRPGGNVPGPVWLNYAGAQSSLYSHLSNQAYLLLDKRNVMTSELNTVADWQKRQASIRETLMDIVGPFPEKTPLNPRILKTVRKNGYRVEHVVFESQPKFYVTASLFIPEGLKRNARVPAVIYCSGHTDIAFRSPGGTYQQLILNLVKKGFIVLAFDPVGQGERLQYFNPSTGKSDVGGATAEHSYVGIQAFITGSSLARHMTFDGIRAVDYLISRKEVDPDRIAITGCSGGGTQTAYIAAFDDRIKVAAPQCYITNFTRLLQSIGPQDAEQNLYHGINRHIDHGDFLLVRAPKPALILSTTEDFFNIHGARETAREVARIYKAYSAESNFSMAEDEGGHGTTRKNREVMYAFFQKHLNYPGSATEEDVEFLSMEELQITETGQVATSFSEGETVFSLNKKDAEACLKNIEANRRDMNNHIPAILKEAERLSGYRHPSRVPEPVLTGCIYKDEYIIEKYFVNGEGDYVIPFNLFKPLKPDNKALIYLHPSGKAVEAAEGGEIEWFVKQGFTVLAADMIGTGELGTGAPVSNSVYFASILIGRSIVGIHAADINRMVMVLQKYVGSTDIWALAKNEMTPALIYASAFNKTISNIALIEPYCSYSSIVMNQFYNPRFISGTVAGALKAYDLPDLTASLAPRKLLIAGVTDGNNNRITTESTNTDLELIKIAYQQQKSSDKLSLVLGEPSKDKLFNTLSGWLK